MDKSKEIDRWCMERQVSIKYHEKNVTLSCGTSTVAAPTLAECVEKINAVELKLKESQGDLFEPGNNLIDKDGNLLLF